MKTKKIIIADNIRSLIENEKSFLNRSSFEVLTVSTNKEVLNIHCAEGADLIVTNMDTEEMDAERLCEIIRENENLCGVSIIVVSPDDEAHTRRVKLCRANDFLKAPLDLGALDEKAHRLISVPKRGAFRAPISVQVRGHYGTEPFLCFSENISSSGMMIETDREMGAGSVLQCTFLLPNSVRVDAGAKVVRVVGKETEYDSNHYGIHFIKISERARDAIDEFVIKG